MRARRTFDILLSISIILAGVCLIAGVLNIYFSGDHAFSREIVAATFSGIAFPVYLCLTMIAVSVVWEIIAPSNKEKKPVKKIKKVAGDSENTEEISDLDAGDKKFLLCRNAFLVVAILFIVIGLINGGTVAVLAKAINICTECIGLG